MTEGKTKGRDRSLLVVLVIVALALLGGWFYWFQYRPVKTRRYCYQITFGKNTEYRKGNLGGSKEWKPGKEWISNPMTEARDDDWGWWYPFQSDFRSIEVWYADCLLEHGMKAEIPISPLLKK